MGNRILQYIFTFILFLFGPNLIQAQQTWYVATTGNDATNNGQSAGAPFKTIGKALSSLTGATDEVVISSGTYPEIAAISQTVKFTLSGTVSVNSIRMLGTSKKLTVNGSAGSRLEVIDSLGLWQGICAVTTANVELHTLTNAKVTGGNKNSFVEPGFYMHHTGNTTKTFRWPIGVGGNYRPVDLEGFNKTIVPDRWFYMQFTPTAPPFSASIPTTTRNISVLNHWFANTNATGSEANSFELTFHFDSVSTNDGVYDHTKLQLLQNPGGTTPPTWAIVKQGGTASRKGTITSDATITPSLGYFVLGNRKGSTTSIGGVNTLGFTDPMASFDVNMFKACVGDTVKFTNKSQNASNVVYQWTFGDEAYTGTVAGKTIPSAANPGPNPWHIYNHAGTYTIKLKITNGSNVSDEANLLFTVGVTPKLTGFNGVEVFRYPHNGKDTFDDLTICQEEQFWMIDNFETSLLGTRNPNNDVLVQTVWKIQGLTPEPTKTVSNPVASMDTFKYTLMLAGSYKVVATRTTNRGCIASDVRDIIIYGKPVPAIDALDQCETPPNSLLRVNNMTANPYPGATNAPLKWMWNYEGLRTPWQTSKKDWVFQNAHPGPNRVYLIVETINGCIDSLPYKDINIFPKPFPVIRLNDTCDNEIMNADATASVVSFGGTIDQYLWDFNWKPPGGSGLIDSNRITTFTYPKAGKYKIQLRVITTDLCTDVVYRDVIISPKPSPAWDVQQVCFGDSTALRRQIQRWPHKDSMMYFWFLDNKYISDDTNFKYLLPNPGSYTLKLVGQSLAGCEDSMVSTIQSFYNPKPTMGLDLNVAGNDTVQCFNGHNYTFNYNYGVDVYDTIKFSRWNFGDSVFEQPAISTTKTYLKPDTFNVALYVENIHGCNDSAVQQIVIHPSPKAGFDYSGKCMPDSVSFTDTISQSERPIVLRAWDFGNGDLDSNQTMLKSLYKNKGPWNVKYTIFTENGCADSITRVLDTLADYPNVSWQIVSGSMPLCKGDSAFFLISGGDSIYWYDDGDTASYKGLSKTGNYRFEVINGGVCKGYDSVQVYAYQAADIKSYSDTIIYRGRQAKLRVDKAMINIRWFPGEYFEDSTLALVTTKRLTDSMTFYVSALDSNGCYDIDSVVVQIIDPPLVKIPNIITPNGDQQNQTWNLIDIPDIHLYDIVISDRQGKRVWESNNYQHDWSGQDQNGNEVPEGVYFYYMKNRYTKEIFKGYIQLVK